MPLWRTITALALVASTVATAAIARALLSGPPSSAFCLSAPSFEDADVAYQQDRYDGGGARGTVAACAASAARPPPLASDPWASASLVLLGAAAAIPVRGTEGRDRLIGTPFGDTLEGLGGDDNLRGFGGPDLIDGGGGRDVIRGGDGTDFIVGEGDGARDDIGCGAGADTVSAGLGDAVALDCETVSRELLRDPFGDFEYQRQTMAEPDSFADGRTIVAVYQVGRARDGGGSAANGFSTSRDAGHSWRSGLLPGLTVWSRPAGSYERASDPSIAYDARHATWLAASLVLGEDGTGIVVSRSADGVAWRAPVVAASGVGENPDKNWIVCDNWPGTPGRGTCYLA
ncbi:MAG: calcium-binding protein, partial [Gaiellaceae bacterium]